MAGKRRESILKNKLILFAKTPVLGKVKTRIALEKGNNMALKVYQYLLNHTINVIRGATAEKIIYSDGLEIQDFGFPVSLQNGNDLGEKMSHAFREQMEENSAICLIGSDCLEINTNIIEQAFSHLKQHELVLGPARDGGYYLIGMKKYHRLLFENITWSTDKVLNQTLQQAQTACLKTALLPELSDIDFWHQLPATAREKLEELGA